MKFTLGKREKGMLAAGLVLVLLVGVSFLAAFLHQDSRERPFVYDPAAAASPLEGLSICTEIAYDRLDAVAVSYPVTGNPEIDRELEAFVQQELERYEGDGAGQGDPSQREFNLSCEVTRFNETVASVSFSVSTDGPKGFRRQTGTYDLSTGASYALSDFFLPASDYRKRLSDYAIERLREDAARADWTLEQWQQLAGPQQIDRFALDGERIRLFFTDAQGEELQAEIPLRLLNSVSLFDFSQAETHSDKEADPPSVPADPPAAAPGQKKIAFLFCDGPYFETTGKILDTLKAHQARATFCPLGNRAAYHPELVKRMASQGHVLCNHTDSHKRLDNLSPGELSTQLKRASLTLSNLTGTSPALLCPPYEAVGAKVKTLDGMQVVLPDLRPQDWRASDGRALADEILAGVYDGCIVQLHDRYPVTAEAVELLLEELPDQGYTLVTVPELLG